MNTQTKYLRPHNSINGNTGCLGYKTWLFVILIGLLVFGCRSKKKADETVAVNDSAFRKDFMYDRSELVFRQKGSFEWSIGINGSDSSIQIEGDTMAAIKAIFINSRQPVVLINGIDTQHYYRGDTIRITPCKKDTIYKKVYHKIESARDVYIGPRN